MDNLILTPCTDKTRHAKFGSRLCSRRLNLDHTDGPPDNVYFTRCNFCTGFLRWANMTYEADAHG